MNNTVYRGTRYIAEGAMMASGLLVEADKSKRAFRAWETLDEQSQAQMSAEMSNAFDAPSEDRQVVGYSGINGLPDHIEAYLFLVRTPTAFIYVVEIVLPRHRSMVLDIILRHRFLTYEPGLLC